MNSSRSTRRVMVVASLAALAMGPAAFAQTDPPPPVQAASTVAPVAVPVAAPADTSTVPAPVATNVATTTPAPAAPVSTKASATAKAPTKTTAKAPPKSAATTTVAAATTGKATRTKAGLYLPNGRPPAAAAGWRWGPVSSNPETPASPTFEAALAKANPGGKLLTALIIGSDARPGEKYTRTRGDSIHLFVWNPKLNKGTIIGFPRDSYVNVAGKGMVKITASLVYGGPTLMMATVNALTAIPTDRYVVTGFEGFTKLINEVGGVNVLVSPKMNEPLSGATFAEGWFAMNGDAALAFNRNRHDTKGGDFGRSANQAKFLLNSLATMRERTNDPASMLTWVNAIRKNAETNLKPADMLAMAQVIRQIDPANITAVVVKGTPVMVKGSSVVKLDNAANTALFDDVRTDGIIGK